MASKTSVLTHLLVGGPVALDTISSISEGEGVVKSIAKAGANFVVNDVITGIVGAPVMMAVAGVQIGKIGYDAAMATGREKTQHVKHNITGTGHVGGGYMRDNEYSATMRQRSLQAIGGAQAQTRNALGNEARKRASSISY